MSVSEDVDELWLERRLAERRSGSPESGGGAQRRRQERRQRQRRMLDLGPPVGIGERRACPDLRGVLFPLFYGPF